jgi:hypothetical protein
MADVKPLLDSRLLAVSADSCRRGAGDRLHPAQSYHWITSHVETSGCWEWAGAAADWLRGLLKRLDEPR